MVNNHETIDDITPVESGKFIIMMEALFTDQELLTSEELLHIYDGDDTEEEDDEE